MEARELSKGMSVHKSIIDISHFIHFREQNTFHNSPVGERNSKVLPFYSNSKVVDLQHGFYMSPMHIRFIKGSSIDTRSSTGLLTTEDFHKSNMDVRHSTVLP